jgi:2'-5' RNA ligase superfamily
LAHAVELFFDAAAETRVRALWGNVAHAQVERLPRCASPLYRPHVSLAVFESDDPEWVVPALRRAIVSAGDLELSLSALGLFVDADRTLPFLVVAANERLVDLHHLLAAVVEAHGMQSRPFYLPQAWTPHCTLPFELADVGDVVAVAAAVAGARLPITASVTEARLVDLDTGSRLALLAGTAAHESHLRPPLALAQPHSRRRR